MRFLQPAHMRKAIIYVCAIKPLSICCWIPVYMLRGICHLLLSHSFSRRLSLHRLHRDKRHNLASRLELSWRWPRWHWGIDQLLLNMARKRSSRLASFARMAMRVAPASLACRFNSSAKLAGQTIRRDLFGVAASSAPGLAPSRAWSSIPNLIVPFRYRRRWEDKNSLLHKSISNFLLE
jgi:hypothetical protein